MTDFFVGERRFLLDERGPYPLMVYDNGTPLGFLMRYLNHLVSVLIPNKRVKEDIWDTLALKCRTYLESQFLHVTHAHAIIYDLEATCWDYPNSHVSEIIEIGAVKIDMYSLKVLGEFSVLIRPVKTPRLSRFCRNLTHISQSEVDGGVLFEEAFQMFRNWIGYDASFTLFSWGLYDKHQLKRDMIGYHFHDDEWVHNHLSLKHWYDQETREQLGLIKMMEKLNITPDGVPHRALVDAKNLAKLFIALAPLMRKHALLPI